MPPVEIASWKPEAHPPPAQAMAALQFARIKWKGALCTRMFRRGYLAQANVRDSDRSHLTRSVGSSIAHCPLTLLILFSYTVAASRPIC